MGRKTWESLPAGRRPLSGRINVVLTTQPDFVLQSKMKAGSTVLTAANLQDALDKLSLNAKVSDIFVVGGTRVYQDASLHPDCMWMYVTRVKQIFEDCDTHFQVDETRFELMTDSEQDMMLEMYLPRTRQDNGIDYEFTVYKHK